MRRGDLVGAAAFAALAAANGALAFSSTVHALEEPRLHQLSIAVFALLRAAIVLAFAWLTLVRRPSRAASHEPIAVVACAAAVVGLMALRSPSASTSLVVAGDLVATAAAAWLFVSVVALGRCFGVLPDARGLVTRGPYAAVRHPVYLGEIGLCAGLAVAAPRPWNVAVLAVVIAAQGMRMHFEERALTAAFPDYVHYAATTPRLLPRVRVRALVTASDQPLTHPRERTRLR